MFSELKTSRLINWNKQAEVWVVVDDYGTVPPEFPQHAVFNLSHQLAIIHLAIKEQCSGYIKEDKKKKEKQSENIYKLGIISIDD